MRYLLLTMIVVISVPFFGSSQSDFKPNGSFRIEIGLPNTATNKAFNDLMQGLVVLTPEYQYTFDNSLSIAAGLRYGFFNVNEFKNALGLSGALHVAGAFAKVGQEKYYGRFGIDYGVRIGYSMNIFATNKNQELLSEPYFNNGGFVEPTFAVSLMASDNASFRLFVAYAFHGFDFRPHQMGVDHFSGFDPAKYNRLTTYFTVGFGYSYYFGKK